MVRGITDKDRDARKEAESDTEYIELWRASRNQNSKTLDSETLWVRYRLPGAMVDKARRLPAASVLHHSIGGGGGSGGGGGAR